MSRLNKPREEELQPKRIAECKAKLEQMGFAVTESRTCLTFKFRGHNVQFYPYSGWHSGRTIRDGRGFSHLLRQLTSPVTHDQE